MKNLNVAPVLGALVIIGAMHMQLALGAEMVDNRTLPAMHNGLPVINKIVGDFEPLTAPDWFLPNHMCVVDSKLSVLQQLQECKKQRKGWRAL
tara:strand:+ start:2032 stop:2310 length:279 start_codon:yes stop_codon:yes gene_type:complete